MAEPQLYGPFRELRPPACDHFACDEAKGEGRLKGAREGQAVGMWGIRWSPGSRILHVRLLNPPVIIRVRDLREGQGHAEDATTVSTLAHHMPV